MRDPGAHRLRGLPAPERIFGVDDAARPAVVGEARPRFGNLPQPPGTIVGREREIASHRLLLRAGETRLLTLTGPGGVGKTRLALEIAAGMGETYPDGVWFVDLAAVRDAAAIVPQIGGVIGARQSFGGDALREVAAALGGRATLLILDNLEQALPASAGVDLLATSRLPLDIRAERVREVEPLPGPPEIARARVTDLGRYPATRLLLERRQERDPEVLPDDTIAPMLAAICARLDGLPLAIELVAARIGFTRGDPESLALATRLGALSAGPLDLPLRQQALASTIAWSYDLLDAAEQAAFRALGVIPAPFDFETAAHVGGCEPALVERLAQRHLLAIAPTRQAGRRYRLLETVREFALAAAISEGEDAAARDRLAAWTAERFAPSVGAPFADAGERLALEEPNLEATLERLLASGQLTSAVELDVAAMWFLLIAPGRWRRGVAVAVRLTDAAQVAGAAPELIASLHLARAQMQYASGAGEAAVAVTLAACQVAMRGAADPAAFFEHRRFLAFHALYCGRVGEAVARVQDLERDLGPSLGDDERQLLLLTVCGVALASGDLEWVAWTIARYGDLAGSGDAESGGDGWIDVEIVQYRAEAAWLAGRLAEAIALQTGLAERYRAAGDDFGLVYTQIDRLLLQADAPVATLEALFAGAEERSEGIDDLVFHADLDCGRWALALRRGALADAAGLVARGLDAAVRLPMVMTQVRALRWLAVIADAAGDAAQAAAFLGGGDGLARQAGLTARFADSPLVKALRARTLADGALRGRYATAGAAPGGEVIAAAQGWRPDSAGATGRG